MSDVDTRRAARKAALAEQRNAQHELDIEAIDALEVEHGDSNIAALEVPFAPGLATLAAVKCPAPAALKRYQARVRAGKDGRPGDPVAAAEEIAAVCIVYPADLEARSALLASRPGLLVQLGVEAVGLAVGRAVEEGKG